MYMPLSYSVAALAGEIANRPPRWCQWEVLAFLQLLRNPWRAAERAPRGACVCSPRGCRDTSQEAKEDAQWETRSGHIAPLEYAAKQQAHPHHSICPS